MDADGIGPHQRLACRRYRRQTRSCFFWACGAANALRVRRMRPQRRADGLCPRRSRAQWDPRWQPPQTRTTHLGRLTPVRCQRCSRPHTLTGFGRRLALAFAAWGRPELRRARHHSSDISQAGDGPEALVGRWPRRMPHEPLHIVDSIHQSRPPADRAHLPDMASAGQRVGNSGGDAEDFDNLTQVLGKLCSHHDGEVADFAVECGHCV